MAYLGQSPVVGRYILVDDISSSFNGVLTSFSLTASSEAVKPGTAQNLLLSLGGVIQKPKTDYTINASTITFTTAPVANTTFFATILGDAYAVGTPSDGTVIPASIADSGNFEFPDEIRWKENSGGNYVGFKAADSLAANTVYTLPSTDGTANQILKTDGNGVLSWGEDPAGQWVTDGTKLYYSGGNVGVGTSTSEIVNGIFTAKTAADKNIGFNATTSETGNNATLMAFTDAGAPAILGFRGSELRFANQSGEVVRINSTQIEVKTGITKISGTNLNINSSYIDFSGDVSTPTTAAAIYRPADNNLAISTGNVERLRIDATGDVKFWGTTNTDDTNKNVNLTAPSFDTNEQDVNLLQFEGEATLNQISIGGGTDGLNAATKIIFRTAAINTVTGTAALTIDSSQHSTFGGAVTIKSPSGADAALYITSDAGEDWNDKTRIRKGEGADLYIELYNGTAWEKSAQFITNAGVDLFYDSGTYADAKLKTESNGVSINGILQMGTTSSYIDLPDNASLYCGTGDDLRIYHGDGTSTHHSYITHGNASGNFFISSQANISLRVSGTDNGVNINSGGGVQLSWDGTPHFETTTDGAKVTGKLNFNNDTNITGTNVLIHQTDSAANWLRFTNSSTTGGATPTTESGFMVGISAGEDAYLLMKENKNIIFQVNDGTTDQTVLTLNGNKSATCGGKLIVDGASAYDAFSSSSMYIDGYICMGRTDTTVSSGNDIGGLRFYSNDSSIVASGSFLQVGGIDCTADGDFIGDYSADPSTASAPTRIVFKTMKTGTTTLTEALRLDSSQNATFGGNVGIGTSNPTQLLHLHSGAVSGGLHLQSNGSTNYITSVQVADDFISGAPAGSLAIRAATGMHFTANGGTHHLAILSSGNVGIGTTNPSRLLTVSTDSTTAYSSTAGSNNGILRLHNINGSDNTGVNNQVGIEMYVSTGATSLGLITFTRTGNNTGDLTYKSRIANGNYAEHFRIKSDGKVGIGTTSPQRALHLAAAGDVALMLQTTNATNDKEIWELICGANASSEADLVFRTRANAGTGGSEAMRITQSGQLNIGTTVDALGVDKGDNSGINLVGTGRLYIKSNDHSEFNAIGGGEIIRFRYGYTDDATTQAHAGDIDVTAVNAVAYTSTSDYRLKENEVAISDGITRLKLLKPYRFNFKSEPSKTLDGFFAHEVQTVVPQAVVGEKDDETRMQGIDQAKMVPLLTAALQEAIAKIEILESKVAALEAA